MNCLCDPDGYTFYVGFNPHSPLLANEFRCSAYCSNDQPGFNPHSPLLANELSRGDIGDHPKIMFQSTFAIAGE